MNMQPWVLQLQASAAEESSLVQLLGIKQRVLSLSTADPAEWCWQSRQES